MIKYIVFWGLCAVLVFVPLPIGSVEEWAVFVFEAAVIALFLLYAGGELFGRGKHKGPNSMRERGWLGESFGGGDGDGGGEGHGAQASATALATVFKVMLGSFLLISILQVIPLPAVLVKILSPRAYDIYLGLARDGIAAPTGWLTLSLAPSASVSEFILILCYGIFGFLVLRTVRSRGQVEIFVLVILASALFQALYGMAEVFSGHEMILGHAKRFNLGSVTGTYINRNHFAGFLEMAFPLSLGYLLVKARYFAMEKGMSLRRRILWFGQESLQWTLLLGLVPVFIGVGIVFSKSKSGIMVLVVTAVLAAAAAASWREFSEEEGEGHGPGTKRRFGRIVRLVVMVVLAVAVWLGIGPVIERFSEMDISNEARRTFYANTVEMIGDFPWAGTGKGTYVNAYAMYEKVDDRLRLSFAHNDYLEFAAENGVVAGGALILAGIGLAVWMAAMWRRRRGSFAKGIGLGAMLGVTALLIHGFTDFNLQIPANAVYFTALAMLGVIVLSRSKKGDTHGEERIVRSDRQKCGGAIRSGTSGKYPNQVLDEEREHVPDVRRGVDSEKRLSEVRRSGSERRFWEIFNTSLRKKGALLIAVFAAVALFVPAFRDFLGFRYLGQYRRARQEARNVESALPALEARLEKATASSPRAVFEVEMARLFVEMARVANDSGREEDRDTFCDKAVAHYGKAIAANPIDAATHYETGTTYLLYNFPLMTYQDRAKAYFREALAFKPADENINLNVIFLYFSWWPTLEDAEKAYAAGIYRNMTARDPGFPAKLDARWKQSYGTADVLTAIVGALANGTNSK